MINNNHMPAVYVQGIFDDLRTYHIRFLQEAAQYGPVHIILHADIPARRMANNRLKFGQDERRYFLENIRYVNTLSISATGETGNLDLPEQEANAGAFWAVLETQVTPQKENFCQQNNLRLLVISENHLNEFPIEPHPPSAKTAAPKVMVSGCFDWVHSGHVRFFEEASQFGNLFVVVGHDENLRLLKGKGHPLFPEQERLYWVQSIRFVKQAVLSTGKGWLDAAPEVSRFKPDIFIVNQDGDVPEKREFFKDLGIEYRVLKRKPKPGLPERISTDLRGF